MAMTDKIPPALLRARQDIDEIDEAIVALLAKRQRVVEQVVGIKQQDGLPALIPSRVAEVVERAQSLARKHGASPDLAQQVWTVMVNWFVAHEAKQLDK